MVIHSGCWNIGYPQQTNCRVEPSLGRAMKEFVLYILKRTHFLGKVILR